MRSHLKSQMPVVFLMAGFISLLMACAQRAVETPGVDRGVQDEISRLLAFADHDHDQKVTVDDFPNGLVPAAYIFAIPRSAVIPANNASGHEVGQPSGHWPGQMAGRKIEIKGIYQLSNLLQELTLQKDGAEFHLEHIFESPTDHISRSIRERYWNGLTRKFDDKSLAQLLPDSKINSGEFRYLYVPSGDVVSLKYYQGIAQTHPELKMKVRSLHEPVSDEEIAQIPTNEQGLLALERDKPFVVPGGRFNEMYGWDSYFEALGLIADDRLDLAQSMVDQFVYEIHHYGKILNANRSYYLNRSQPPFLTAMASAVAEKMPNGKERDAWLEKAMLAAQAEYQDVWMGQERLTPTGLSRYAGSGVMIPPETEKGSFDFVLKPVADRHHISIETLISGYNDGSIKDAVLNDFFRQDRAVRESGHDTTYRWRVGDADRASDFVTVDLNSLLYRYELDFAKWAKKTGRAANAKKWSARAAHRRKLMLKLLWNEHLGVFADYNFKTHRHSNYITATSFYPFWADAAFLPEARAQASIRKLLGALEQPGGLSATSEVSLKAINGRPVARQWEYPNGWAPHQMVAWAALANESMLAEQTRLVRGWIQMITVNATKFNGTIPEKYDVVRRSHDVFSEYGNVGTRFSYMTKEGFGWMNASYQVGLKLLSPRQISEINQQALESVADASPNVAR